MKSLLALVLLVAGLPASAQFFTGQQLKEHLDEAEAGSSFAKRTIAMGYIAGVHDTVAQREVCSTAALSGKQSMALVHRYLRAHPERLGQPAAPLVVAALSEAFPCTR